MKCQYCNSNIPEAAAVCPVCGAISPVPVPETETGYEYQPVPEERVTPFTALKKYAVFSGRARRKEFWLFKLLELPLAVAGQFIMTGAITSRPVIALIAMISLGLVIPDLAVFCRRMHDVGKSGWMWLWNLLPLAGMGLPSTLPMLSLVSNVILLFFELKDSQPGSNKYGPNPKGM